MNFELIAQLGSLLVTIVVGPLVIGLLAIRQGNL
uniref:Photosystem II reaction center protein Psb30 n=1 Tax=Eutreptiella sp. CCMP389 TaxID=96781 RepID=A0A977K891_9EUGL|nr:photosystem II reaction center protein psb30 [Eutreptiella sp. CCMP389]UXD06459.1 photosystem II reaction center protein psb30 [Eutreptiella sp. CCMP1594]